MILTNEIGRTDGRMKIHNFHYMTPKERTTAFDCLTIIRIPWSGLSFKFWSRSFSVMIFNMHAPFSGVLVLVSADLKIGCVEYFGTFFKENNHM